MHCSTLRPLHLAIATLLVGCGWGGAGGGGPARDALPARPQRQCDTGVDPVQRGELLYGSYGCRMCHGEGGVGGVDNANSETAGKINGLTLVKEGYTPQQLADAIARGVLKVGQRDPNGPTPPWRMPAYGRWLSPTQLSDLSAYLMSLYPKDREIEDDWDDE